MFTLKSLLIYVHPDSLVDSSFGYVFFRAHLNSDFQGLLLGKCYKHNLSTPGKANGTSNGDQ